MKFSKSHFATLIILVSVAQQACAGHLYPEKHYQACWCSQQGGIQEYVLPDRARVDCLLPEYAVEFDFAQKWAESIGQALYYGIMTDRQPAVVLIMENPDQEERYLTRLRAVCRKYGIKVWTLSECP